MINTPLIDTYFSLTEQKICNFIHNDILSSSSFIVPNHNILIDLKFKSLHIMRFTSFIFSIFIFHHAYIT